MNSSPSSSSLQFPFEDQDLPDPSGAVKITEGVFWLRLPLPMVLNHINIWLLKDGDGWTVVDTGFHSSRSRSLWQQVFKDVLEGRPITKVVVTHMHPDHIGQADWLCQCFDCGLYMSQGEFFYAHYLANMDPENYVRRMEAFYARMGIGQLDGEGREGMALTPQVFSCLPLSFNRLKGGDSLVIDGVPWHLVAGSGHSPEHICLYSPDKKLLLSGDQVLPSITSNISVYAEEPEANPLAEWLDSCRNLQEQLPADLLVLPAHGQPFYGLHSRLSALIESHEKQLERLRQFLVEPHSCADTLPLLFSGQLSGFNRLIAATEALAHINYLMARGEVKRLEENGVYLYQLRPVHTH